MFLSLISSINSKWDNLDVDLRNYICHGIFKNVIFFVSQDHPQIVFITNIIHKGLNLLQSFVSILSHLRPQKFKHIFQDSLNRLCTCGLHIQKKNQCHILFSTAPNFLPESLFSIVKLEKLIVIC